MAVEVHCPRCNAVFAAGSNIQIGARIPCPRCDATFAVLHLHEVTASPSTNGLAAPLVRTLSVTSARRASASWQPQPSAWLDLAEAVLATALFIVLAFTDGRQSILPVLLGITAGFVVALEMFHTLSCLLRRAPLGLFLFSQDRHGFYRAPRLLGWLALVQLLYVLLTVGEGFETLKVLLVLSFVALAAGARLAFSFADLDNRPLLLGVGGGVLVVGVGLAWLVAQRLADYSAHRYYIADLVLCFLGVTVVVQVVYALFRIQDVRKFRLACTVVGMMGVMSTASLGLARATVSFRRDNDAGLRTKKTKRPGQGEMPDRQPAALVPPLQLDGLRWLPRDTVALASVRPAEMSGGAQLDQPIQVGPLNVPVQQLETWTGLKADEIDHIVVFLGGRGGLLPRFVIRTRQPIDANAVRAKFKRIELHEGAKKQGVYLFKLDARPPFDAGMLRAADDRTLLIDWQQDSTDWITTDPFKDAQHLPAPIRDAVAQRLKPHGSLWLAGHSDEWLKAILLLSFLKLDKAEQELAATVQTFVVWTPLEPKNTWMAVVRCKDAEGAEKTKAYLEKRLEGGERKVTLVAEGEWLTVQIQTRK